MRVGVLTSGGDTAALNAILYGIHEEARRNNSEVEGFFDGWEGTIGKTKHSPLLSVSAYKGGTVLRTSRLNLTEENLDEAARNIESIVDGFISIGGDDSLSVARKLAGRLTIPTCFVAKTIDNDVGSNASPRDFCFSKIKNYFNTGFPSAALRIASYASDLRTTTSSHKRIMILEAMGRQSGWLALSSCLAEPTPDFIIVPESALDYEDLKEKVAKRYRDKGNVLVVVAEGARYSGSEVPITEDKSMLDEFGNNKLGGVAYLLARRLKKDLKIENVNDNNPSHWYRCGAPSALDRDVGIALGASAFKAIKSGSKAKLAVTIRMNTNILTETFPIEEILRFDDKGKIIPRQLDKRFYDKGKLQASELGREYFYPFFSYKGRLYVNCFRDSEDSLEILDESGFSSGLGISR